MEIIYKNIYDKQITASQATNSGDYEKIYKEAGIVRKIESFMSNSIYAITHYLQVGENETEILSNLNAQIERENKVVILRQTQTLGIYSIEIDREYRNEVLSFKNRYLYDQDNRLICEESLSLDTDAPIYEKTIKYYYGINYNLFEELYEGDPIFKAKYNTDGSLDIIHLQDPENSPQDDEYFDATDFNVLAARGPAEEDITYYFTATFEPS